MKLVYVIGYTGPKPGTFLLPRSLFGGREEAHEARGDRIVWAVLDPAPLPEGLGNPAAEGGVDVDTTATQGLSVPHCSA